MRIQEAISSGLGKQTQPASLLHRCMWRRNYPSTLYRERATHSVSLVAKDQDVIWIALQRVSYDAELSRASHGHRKCHHREISMAGKQLFSRRRLTGKTCRHGRFAARIIKCRLTRTAAPDSLVVNGVKRRNPAPDNGIASYRGVVDQNGLQRLNRLQKSSHGLHDLLG